MQTLEWRAVLIHKISLNVCLLWFESEAGFLGVGLVTHTLIDWLHWKGACRYPGLSSIVVDLDLDMLCPLGVAVPFEHRYSRL